MGLEEVTFKAFCDKCNTEMDKDISVFCPDCIAILDGQEDEKKTAVLYAAIEMIEEALANKSNYNVAKNSILIEKITGIINDAKTVVEKPKMLDTLVAISRDFAQELKDTNNRLGESEKERSSLRLQMRKLNQIIERTIGNGRTEISISDLKSIID